MITKEDRARLAKAGYALLGKHSAAKICLWTKRSLLGRGYCYKQKFYGIASHRCLQMTPALPFCTLACRFCWRDTRLFSPEWRGGIDEPEKILDDCIAAQRHLLNGFPGNPKTDEAKWREAQAPKHVALSLDGEPTLYPKLPELIEEIRGRGMTSFLVTNGTQPKMLEKLADEGALPTQLYVSVCAFDEKNYEKTVLPRIKQGWTKLNETLALLPSLKTRKVIRLTLVKGLNFGEPEKYAELIAKAEPDFVEAKGYVNVGYSTQRLTQENMPAHSEIIDFGKALAEETGYILTDDARESRVALLCRNEETNEKRWLKCS